MVCNMASKAENMEVELASSVQKEMAVMIQEEEQLREKINAMVSVILLATCELSYGRMHETHKTARRQPVCVSISSLRATHER